MKTFILSVLLSAVTLATAEAQDQEYSFQERFDPGTPLELNLTTGDGFIHVFPATDGRATINFIVFKGDRFQEIGRTELEDKLDLEIISDGNKIEVVIRNPGNNSWSDWKNSYNVSLEAYVPAATACKLTTSDGDIRLAGLDGDQRCRTSDGDIKVTALKGNLDAATSDGDVTAREITGSLNLVTNDGDVKAEDVDGDVTVSTSDGDIRLYNVPGVMKATTSDGDILFTDCAGSLKGVTSDGDLRGNLTKLKGMLSLSTSDGTIEVVIPEGTGIDLKMRGEDVYLPGIEVSGQVEDDYIKGTVYGGGIPVDLTTSDGDVKLIFK